jgi:hypothetical protein
MTERGATEAELIATVEGGESFAAKFGRTAFRRNFNVEGTWRGKPYRAKQLEVVAAREGDDWLAITVVVKYF